VTRLVLKIASLKRSIQKALYEQPLHPRTQCQDFGIKMLAQVTLVHGFDEAST